MNLPEIEGGEALAVFARRVVATDPGIPIGLLVYRLAGNTTPDNGTRKRLYQVINSLLLSGWLRDVKEGDDEQRPVSRRVYLAVPFCGCGDSVYSGRPCPDGRGSGDGHGLKHCPARKRAGIAHV